MLLTLLIGMTMVLLCLALQAFFIATCIKQYRRLKIAHQDRHTLLQIFILLSAVLMLMLLANLIQMVMWAALFRILGEFTDFSTALYHSGVNFATLGYGDITPVARWRLLGPLTSMNGILLFGWSTAVIFEVLDRALLNTEKIVE